MEMMLDARMAAFAGGRPRCCASWVEMEKWRGVPVPDMVAVRVRHLQRSEILYSVELSHVRDATLFAAAYPAG